MWLSGWYICQFWQHWTERPKEFNKQLIIQISQTPRFLIVFIISVVKAESTQGAWNVSVEITEAPVNEVLCLS